MKRKKEIKGKGNDPTSQWEEYQRIRGHVFKLPCLLSILNVHPETLLFFRHSSHLKGFDKYQSKAIAYWFLGSHQYSQMMPESAYENILLCKVAS